MTSSLNAFYMLIDIIGWFGSLLVVLAYTFNISKKLDSGDIRYYLLNIIGSACLIVNTIYHHALPSAAVNVIWMFIPLFSLARKMIRPRI
jgi:hypothetical protein